MNDVTLSLAHAKIALKALQQVTPIAHNPNMTRAEKFAWYERSEVIALLERQIDRRRNRKKNEAQTELPTE